MVEWLFRKEILSKVDENAKDYARLLKDKYKIDLLALYIIALFFIFPFSALVAYVVVIEHTIFNIVVGIIAIIAVGTGSIYFFKRFTKEIIRFKNDIAINMYNKRYLRKGKALSEEDFKTIKEKNDELHYVITRLMAQGYCYSVCFELLKALEKGEMLYLGVYSADEESKGKTYTMHVLYVNGDWCYDSYSEKQLPLEKVLKASKGKIYRSYSYDDIKDREYDQFRNEEVAMLREWCKQNDCYEEFIEDKED